MAQFRKIVITDAGRALTAKMIANGLGIQFKNIQTSEDVYAPDQLVSLVNFNTVNQSSLISNISRSRDTAIKIDGGINNTTLTQSYYCSTVGVTAIDPDEGEIIYGATIIDLTVPGNIPDFVPAFDHITSTGIEFSLILAIDSAADVTITVDPAATVTSGYLDEIIASIEDRLEAIGSGSGSGSNIYIDDAAYQGVDLTVKFATEIASYATVWRWIAARVAASNFEGIRHGDYIPFTTTNGYQILAEVAGINTYYYKMGSTWDSPHIDFISRDVWPVAQTFTYVGINSNNGTSVSKSPYLASNIYLWLNSLVGQVASGNSITPFVQKDYTTTGVYDKLPADLQAVISTKEIDIPTRMSSSSCLTEDNGTYTKEGVGKLWLPYEIEIFGRATYSSQNLYGGLHLRQYPRLNTAKSRLKMANGSTVEWWTASAVGGADDSICLVDRDGNESKIQSAANCNAPVCFRIGS